MKNILIALSLVVLGKLHEGDHSEVFEVQDPTGNVQILKCYKEEKKSSISSFSYLFGDWEREFEIGTALDHPSIVKVKARGGHCLVLEHAKGKPLCKFNKKSLTQPQGLDISLQLIDAIQYAFCHQYSNTDVQLRNVLINEELKVKIIDLAYFISFDDLKKHYEGSEWKMLNAWVRHFNVLTDVCMQVFDKVDLTRDERIRIRLAIKQIAWNLVEDHEENKEISFESQFDLLRASICRNCLRTDHSIPIE